MEHTPKEPRKLKYRVTGLAKQPSGTPVGGGAKADPREAEDVAAAFERSWQRFPVLVGHLVGYQGARCDVLSFSTEEDAEAFQKNTLANPFERAERVIEVKGRGDMNAKILLEGNEFDAAKEHRSKYYLYRVFKDGAPDNWQLAVLKNPYSTESSHLDSLLVSLQKSDQTEKFRICVALKESADLR